MHRISTIVLCSFATVGLGQGLSSPAFNFLHVPGHARLAALGGVNVSLADRDVNFFHDNPALIGDTLNGFASAGYQFYVGDVGNAMLTYAHGSGAPASSSGPFNISTMDRFRDLMKREWRQRS